MFLMNNVHEDAPVLFNTRWVLSYLRGPLTRQQIRILMKDRREEALQQSRVPARSNAAQKMEQTVAVAKPTERQRPVVPADITESFFPVRRRAGREAKLVYRPALVGTAELHYANSPLDLDHWSRVACLTPLHDDLAANVWAEATTLENAKPEFASRPDPDAEFAELPSAASKSKMYTTWERRFKTHLYRTFPLTMWKSIKPKVISEAGESERDFTLRVRDAARERRDLELEKLRNKYAPRLERIQDRIERAKEKLSKQKAQYSEKKGSTLISIGTTILGAMFGRKVKSVGTVGRAATTARRAGSARKEKLDVEVAKKQLIEQQEKLAELEAKFTQDLAEKRTALDPDEVEYDEKTVAPRKSDITIGRVALTWLPYWVGRDGIAEPAFE